MWKRLYRFATNGTWDKLLTVIQAAADAAGPVQELVALLLGLEDTRHVNVLDVPCHGYVARIAGRQRPTVVRARILLGRRRSGVGNR